MNKKLDRRRKYTQMVLKDSLITILKTKQLSAITIKEVCEKADINRSTFYAHYQDLIDLMKQIEEEIIEDLNAYLSQYDFAKEDESLQMTEKLLEYIASKYDTCQTLLNESNNLSFELRVMNVVRGFLLNNQTDRNDIDAEIAEYAGTFLIGGGIYVIKHWLENNMDQPVEEIARLINSITIQRIKDE